MLNYNEFTLARQKYEDVMAIKGRPEIAPVVIEKNVIAEVITAFKAAFAKRPPASLDRRPAMRRSRSLVTK